MIEIRGKYASAKIFTNEVEDSAMRQALELLDQPFVAGQKVRFMPDIHAGAGCTIGTTMTLSDKVVPNLVGVDIGCGVLVAKLIGVKEIDFPTLDAVIRERVPSGMNVHEKAQFHTTTFLASLRCENRINWDRVISSIGTLGGGNHFIEVAKGEKGDYYLLIHTGSRSLGLAVAKHYQSLAVKERSEKRGEISEVIERLKKEGREREIPEAISIIQKQKQSFNKDLAYLEGASLENYLHDLFIAQRYAEENRKAILGAIAKEMRWNGLEGFTTVHNYIDKESGILRKGAVSAKKGESLVIPINMRDGSLLCVGKGNPDWNESAPHGAGRILSRGAAKRTLNMEDFAASMKGIYTTSVGEGTLDESPMAYKPIESILENISETVDVIERIRPVYNFKASQ